MKIADKGENANDVYWMTKSMHWNHRPDHSSGRSVNALPAAHFCDTIEVLAESRWIDPESAGFAVGEMRNCSPHSGQATRCAAVAGLKRTRQPGQQACIMHEPSLLRWP